MVGLLDIPMKPSILISHLPKMKIVSTLSETINANRNTSKTSKMKYQVSWDKIRSQTLFSIPDVEQRMTWIMFVIRWLKTSTVNLNHNHCVSTEKLRFRMTWAPCLDITRLKMKLFCMILLLFSCQKIKSLKQSQIAARLKEIEQSCTHKI